MEIAGAILPVVVIVCLGFAAVRTGYLPEGHIRPLADAVLKIALPALVFQALVTPGPGGALNPALLAAYAAGSLGAMAGGIATGRLLLKLPLAGSAMIGLGAAAANSGFLGYPIGSAVLGPEAARVLAHCMVVENALVIPLALALSSGARGLAGTLAALVRNPLMIALAAGLAAAALGLSLPGWASRPLAMVAGMAAPAALIAIGGMLAGLPLRGLARAGGGILVIAAGKLVLHPLLVAGALALTPGVPEGLARGAILFAAMPMITIFPILAARGGLGALAAPALMATTLAGFASVAVVLHLLGLG